MADNHYKIAIDGPSGAGKSTVAKAVARKLGIEYIDTGAMYRALGLKLLQKGISFDDENAIKDILAQTQIDFADGDILLDGKIVSQYIRTPEVSMAASRCSAYDFVRKELVKAQQEMGSSKSVVMDGRDICDVVFPDAQYKYFITASDEERALRRYRELAANGEEVTFDKVLDDIRQRDYNDSTRAVSPLRKSADAQELDTTDMSIDEVVDYICSQIKA